MEQGTERRVRLGIIQIQYSRMQIKNKKEKNKIARFELKNKLNQK